MMKTAESAILSILQRRFSLGAGGFRSKRSGVRIDDRRWRREIDALDRQCEMLRKRMNIPG